MTTEGTTRRFNLPSISWKWIGIVFGGILILAINVAWVFWVFCVNYVPQYAVGYKFDRRTGETIVLNRTGYFINPPYLVKVYHIDTRPSQVCINANNRVLNCKLVQFVPAGIQEFWKLHGIEFEGGVYEILKSYAYDGQNKDYPFMAIKTELGAQPFIGPKHE